MSCSFASNRPIIMSERLQKLRENRKHCDVLFVDENGSEFYAHKCLLAITTDIFEFEYDAYYHLKAESHLKNREVERIHLGRFGVKGSVFQTILNIIYETKPKITLDEAVDVLFAAKRLLMDAVASYAEDVIVDNNFLKGKPQQLAKLCHLPGLQNCQKLLNHVTVHLHGNFSAVSQLPEFYRISLDVLCALGTLKKSDLFLSATTCVDFIVKWITYDLDNRIANIRAIVEYLDPFADNNTEDDGHNEFLDAITDTCRNTNDRNKTIALLRFGLQGMLRESVDKNFCYTYSFTAGSTTSFVPPNSSNCISGRYNSLCKNCRGTFTHNITMTRSRANCPNRQLYLDWFDCDEKVDT